MWHSRTHACVQTWKIVLLPERWCTFPALHIPPWICLDGSIWYHERTCLAAFWAHVVQKQKQSRWQCQSLRSGQGTHDCICHHSLHIKHLPSRLARFTVSGPCKFHESVYSVCDLHLLPYLHFARKCPLWGTWCTCVEALQKLWPRRKFASSCNYDGVCLQVLATPQQNTIRGEWLSLVKQESCLPLLCEVEKSIVALTCKVPSVPLRSKWWFYISTCYSRVSFHTKIFESVGAWCCECYII